jgi:hypothetical protein
MTFECEFQLQWGLRTHDYNRRFPQTLDMIA